MKRTITTLAACFCIGVFGLNAQSLDDTWSDSTQNDVDTSVVFGFEKEGVEAVEADTVESAAVEEKVTYSVFVMQTELDTAGASAVILNDDKLYSYIHDFDNIVERVKVSKKVLIKDISALSEFSQFYFAQGKVETRKSSESAAFDAGFTIIKPSGERIELDLANAEENDETVPYVFTAGNSDVVYYRTAVSNLEIGDVVEFHHQSEIVKPLNGKLYKPTELQYELLGEGYPIIRKSIKVRCSSSRFRTRWFSMNGAPDFEEKLEKGYNGSIEMIVRNIPALKSPRFYTQLRAEPFVKFQTYFVNIDNNYYVTYSDLPYDLVHPSPKDLNKYDKGLRDDDLEKSFKSMPYQMGENGKLIGSIYKRMKKVKASSSYTDLEYGLMLYEIFHDVYFEEYARPGVTGISDYQFCNVMSMIFMRSKRKLDLVAYIPKRLGAYEDLRFYEELGMTVRIKDGLTNEYFYFEPFTLGKVRHVNEVENVDGQEIKWLTIPRSVYQSASLISSQVPHAEAKDNESHSQKNLTLNLDDGKIQVQSLATYTGTRAEEASAIAVPRITYVVTKPTKNKKKVAIQQAKRALLHERYQGYRMQYYQGDWESDYSVARYDSLSTGSNDNLFVPEVKIEEQLVLDDLLHAAGDNFIFDAGRLIGSQFFIEEKERKRDKDISAGYPRTLTNTITFDVPSGYTLENLEAFNCSEDNDAGSFIASASKDGNTVTIETQKIYKNANLPVEEWESMVQFLDLAHDFTYKKLLLKKL